MHFEEQAASAGYTTVVGIDEAGRGPLAGPVVAAACYLPSGTYIPGVDDSKKLSPARRRSICEQVTNTTGIKYGIGIASAAEVDAVNIYQATIVAMWRAVANSLVIPDHLLVDGMALAHPTISYTKIVQGDSKSQSIAVASNIAKEFRDELMRLYHMLWPQYGFDKHKGYGTQQHRQAIEVHGLCPIHRKSFTRNCSIPK